jgi:Reverse transcriptase (RNA-dependent DNA polymerase)
MHQQNGCAERFIRTIVEKAQAIRLEACIPQNWWEFAVNYAVHIYNQTPLKHSSNDYKMLFERLHRTKPDVAHLRVFRCGAYVFLPEDVRSNNLSPRSELMTFIGVVEGTKGYIFMRSPDNVVFTAIQALFDKTLFPKCLTMRRLGYTPVGLPPDDLQGEHNGPLDDENGEYGNGLPPIPVGPAGGQAPWQHMQPQQPPLQPPQQQQRFAYPPLPPLLSSRSSGLLSPVRSRAPSLSPRHSPAPHSDYDHDFFFSKEDKQEYFRRQDIWRQGMEKKKTKEAFKYYSAGGNEPLDYDTQGNISPYLWYRLQQQQRMQNVPQPPPQPQEKLSGSQPRRSGHERRPVVRPDNVYGSRNPTQSEQMSNKEFREIIDDVPAPSGSSNRPDSPPYEGKGKKRADYLVDQMVQKGGVGLINFFLRAAVSSADAKEKIPEVSKVHEWHYRDLMRLPKATQEEWKIACKEELEALCQCNVFKLIDLPKGRKTIGCRWVFDVKSDGRKKARLVAQGFSQVEGIH